MILTVIGSGTAVPSAVRGSPCCHLSAGGRSIVFDLGSGSVRQLWKAGIDVRAIDSIFFSHFHPDHTADLVPLLFALRNPDFGGGDELVLAGPRGLKAYLESLREVYGDWIQPPGMAVHVLEMDGKRLERGPVTVTAARSGHTAESLAFRAECEEKTVVYGGDSVSCASLVAIAGKADLLVLESSYPEGREGEGHMTPGEAASVAELAAAKKLLLTHFYPAADESDCLTPARSRFRGEVVLAYDGLSMEVGGE